MIEREQLKFPSILFQFLDGFFEKEPDDQRFMQTLNHLSVTKEEFRDPSYTFDGNQLLSMLELLRNSSIYEPASLRVLQHLSVSNLGMIGIAGLTAVSLREALGIAIKFHPYVLPAVELRGEEDGDFYRLEARLTADFGESSGILMEIILGTLKQLADEFTGDTLDFTITFSHAPAFGTDKLQTLAMYEKHFNCRVAFNAPGCALVFPQDYLEKRLKRQNPIMHSYAQNIAEKELAYQNSSTPLTLKVSRLLEDALENEVSISPAQVADKLYMSPRTLSRKLAKENTHYKTLLNEVRFERAKTLLKKTDIPIKQVAAKLGFANSDAFARAFKAHTGTTPNQWKAGK